MSTTKRTGTIEWHDDHWDVRPTLSNGKRGKRLHQPVGMSEARARDKAQALTDAAEREGTVREVVVEEAPAKTVDGPTLEDWATAWCEDRERRGLTSVDDDRGRLRKWILPRLSPPLGKRPIRSIAKVDLQALVEDLDGRVLADELHWKTAKNCWGLVTKLFKDAVKSKTAALRVLDDNPARDVAGPDEGVVKSKAYLFPAEFLAMMVCQRIPIRWRRLFAAAIYTYTRAGEFEALALDDVDLEHLRVHVHRSIDRNDGEEKETKTNTPRHVPMEPTVVPLFKFLVQDRAAAPRLFAMPPLCDLSERLRTYLRCAGVTRAALFANDATRKQITFHDLRATGITWMAIRGDDPMRIMHRAGHVNISTTMGYVREAESLDFLRGDVFPAIPKEVMLPGALPEGPSFWGSLRNDKGKECPQRDLNPRNSLERAGSWAGLDDGDQLRGGAS